MRLAYGRVVGGHVIVEGEALTEGETVTVLLPDNEPFTLTPEEEEELLESIAEADRGEVVDARELLRELRASID